MSARILTIIDGIDTPVTIAQSSNKRFVVVYGEQVKANLTYEQAAKNLGECILHSACCVGLFTSTGN